MYVCYKLIYIYIYIQIEWMILTIHGADTYLPPWPMIVWVDVGRIGGRTRQLVAPWNDCLPIWDYQRNLSQPNPPTNPSIKWYHKVGKKQLEMGYPKQMVLYLSNQVWRFWPRTWSHGGGWPSQINMVGALTSKWMYEYTWYVLISKYINL